MSNSKGTILIGGGRGFIGGHLCSAFLKNGFNVISIDSGLFETSRVFLENATSPYLIDLTLDASDYEDAKKTLTQIHVSKSINSVINCVGPARPSYYMEHPIETASTLVNCTHSLLKLAIDFNVLYIHASSSEVYGDIEKKLIEEDTLQNVNPLSLRAAYPEAKRFSETLTMSYVRELGLRATLLRLFNVYGPGFSTDDDRVVAAFVRALLDSRELEIHGDGMQIRSFCFIDDVVKAFEHSIMHNTSPFLCVNIGNPEPVSILSLAKLIEKYSGRASRIRHTQPRQDDVTHRVPVISKARHLLGWFPRINLEDGLKKTLHYYGLA